MIQYLTECKTDKTVVHKIEWNTDKITEFEKKYIIGEKCLHKTKKQALDYIEKMKDIGIDEVFIGKHISIHRRKK
jgi:hypothetical protein